MGVSSYKSVSGLVCRVFYGASQHRSMKQQLQQLKKQQNSISMQEEFARYSKLQRNINKLTDQLKQEVETRRSQRTRVSYTIKSVVYVAIMFCLFYWCRTTPVVVLPTNWFPYVGRFLAIPTGLEGAIGLPAWVLVCRQFMKSLLA